MNTLHFKLVFFLLVTSLSFSACSSLTTRNDKETKPSETAATPASPAPASEVAAPAVAGSEPPGGATEEIKAVPAAIDPGPAEAGHEKATPPTRLPEKKIEKASEKATDDGGPQIVLKPKKGHQPLLVEKAKAKSGEPVVQTDANETTENSAPPETAEKVAPHENAKKVQGVDPTQALKWLQNGNKRFVKGYLRKDGESKKDILALSKGQSPHAIVLSCSDSRVPPELVFDQKLGEIFVVRTAGESLDPNVIASIEYAVEHLGPRLLIVMGHSSCGAIKASVDTLDGKDAGSPALNHLVADIQPRLKEITSHTSPGLVDEANANSSGIVADLIRRSALLKQAVDEGRLVIKTALYEMNSGEVKFP